MGFHNMDSQMQAHPMLRNTVLPACYIPLPGLHPAPPALRRVATILTSNTTNSFCLSLINHLFKLLCSALFWGNPSMFAGSITLLISIASTTPLYYSPTECLCVLITKDIQIACSIYD